MVTTTVDRPFAVRNTLAPLQSPEAPMAIKIDASSEVQRILTLIARSIVDEPAKVRVDAEAFDNETVMRLQVAPNDLWAITGPGGDIRLSLRSLVADMSVKYKQLFALDIRATGAE